MSCADQWSPWPFVALGVLFAGAGLVLLLVDPPRALTSASEWRAEAAGSAAQT